MADDENNSNPNNERSEESESVTLNSEVNQEESIADDSKEEKSDKSPRKNTTQKKEEDEKEDDDDKEDDDEEDSDDEDEGEELPPGLLEQPLEVTGKREKKKVERLSAAMIRPEKEKKKVEIEEGSGKRLGDIPYIEHQLITTKAMDLKSLHRLLFLQPGTLMEIKKNIRQFCGFTHSKDSKEFEKRDTLLNKMVATEVKSICTVLGLERGGSKANLKEKVLEFLQEPEDKGLKIKIKAKKKPKSAKGKKGTKRKRKPKEGEKKEKKKKKEDDDTTQDDDTDEKDEDGEDAEEDESEEEEEEEESEDEAPKKKKAKVENKKKTPPKKVAKVNGKKEKPPPKKEKPPPKKQTKKSPAKKKPAPELSDSLSSDSDDEPIAKKIAKAPPSNDEIKELVKKILDGADLETVTMKTVVKQVYAKYPSFDLSDRKDFIKDTVREVIS